jgi:ankyrin repeat protein
MTQLLRLLLQKGADPDAVDEKGGGWTPLMLSARAGQRSAVQVLLEAGADPLRQNLAAGSTALHLAAANGKADVCACLAQREPAALAVLNADGKAPAQVAKTPELSKSLAALATPS